MSKKSYAQCGQDLLVEYLLKKNRRIPNRGYKGRYVDVGACYPVKSSNTYLFYLLGWAGLCVDANPEMRDPFIAERPNDTFVSAGVGPEPGRMEFFTYTNPQWNSFDPERARKKRDVLTGRVEVAVRPLGDMITETFGAEAHIDLLSIDTEGFELNVLKSLDLERQRPALILMESIRPVMEAGADPSIAYLIGKGYDLMSHTGHDAFMLDSRQSAIPRA